VKTRPRSTPAQASLVVGDRIALLPHCPIDFEGVGPLPGMKGEIVNIPSVHDFRRCVGVRFDDVACEWLIPSAWLKKQRSVNHAPGD